MLNKYADSLNHVMVYVEMLVVNPYPARTFATSIEPGQSAHPCSLTMLYTVG